MLNTPFKIIYLALFLVALMVRKIYTAKNRKMDFIKDEKSGMDITFLVLNGVGMIIPLIYVFSDAFAFAEYQRPDWAGWLGAVLFCMAIWLLFRSHADLGKNWTATLAIQKEHKLVSNGIYKHIRHPMYAAHILWAVAQILIIPNWIAGFSFIVVMIPHYLLRVDKEEQIMIDQFGNDYKDYAEKTGRIFPRM